MKVEPPTAEKIHLQAFAHCVLEFTWSFAKVKAVRMLCVCSSLRGQWHKVRPWLCNAGSLGCVEQIPAGYSRAITFRHTSTTLARLCMTWHLTRWWMRPTAFLALRAEREVGTAAETVSAYVPTRPMSSRVKSCGSDGTVSKGDHPRIPLLLSAFCLDPKLTRSIQQERTRTC